MTPSDEAELMHMVATACQIDDRPSAIRYPRGEALGIEMPARGTPLAIGKGRVVREGSKVAILSLGTRLEDSLAAADDLAARGLRSEEHTSELQALMRNSYAVFCLKKK